MGYEFIFDQAKNTKLINERNISFEEIICLINENKLVDIVEHHNPGQYPNQQIYLIDVEGYIYLVPFEKQENKIFLKTIFPSRKHTKKYKKEVEDE